MNSQKSIVQVFVYGTLKPGESNYQTYCQGKTIAEIKAYTKGQLYHLSAGYPAMTVGNNQVKGYLLSFDSSNILISLDCLENYQETRYSKYNDYYRQKVPVYSLSDSSLGNAWCYLMTQNKVAEFQGQLLTTDSWYSNSIINFRT
jgi:gamma-glutamylcyclotransferase (GGCT)/AIG2-like uncharacterized protein YtfP